MDKLDRIAKRIIASPTIWNTSPYKVTVYPDEAEGKHKERHISVNVNHDSELGNISIKNGDVLNGNLSPKTIKWCINTLLTEENKYRINLMIENKEFYRLDMYIEVKAHPITDNKTITAFKIEPSWEDKLIKNVKYIDGYYFKVVFKNGEVKVVNIEPYIKRHEKIFKQMIEDEKIIKNFMFDSIEIYWNDLMGIEAETLYDL